MYKSLFPILILASALTSAALQTAAGNAAGAPVMALWAALWMVLLCVGPVFAVAMFSSAEHNYDSTWDRLFWIHIRTGAHYTTAAREAHNGAMVAAFLIPIGLLLAGPLGLFWTIGVPTLHLLDGADKKYCCSPIPTDRTLDGAELVSPDSRWVVLASVHDPTFSNKYIEVMVVDLDRQRPVNWDTGLFHSVTETMEVRKDEYDGYLSKLEIHATVKSITVLKTPLNEQLSAHAQEYTLPIPDEIKTEWVSSWNSQEPQEHSIAWRRNYHERACLNRSWVSADLRRAMLWTRPAKEESHWYTFWRPDNMARSKVEVRDVSSGAVLRTTMLRFLPAPARDSETDGFTSKDQCTFAQAPIPVSNASGTSWLIFTDDYLKFISVPASTAPARASNREAERPAPTSSSESAAKTGESVERAGEVTIHHPGASAAPDTAAATVRAFYARLGRGDGTAASNLMIPEKRNAGPFSAESMTRFYGSLDEPVELTDLSTQQPGEYLVWYHYRAGHRSCDGSARVTTTQRGGIDLIDKIAALGGC